MVRSYTDEPLDPEALARIVDAGVRSPSAGFSQGQRFVVVTDPNQRQALLEMVEPTDRLNAVRRLLRAEKVRINLLDGLGAADPGMIGRN